MKTWSFPTALVVWSFFYLLAGLLSGSAMEPATDEPAIAVDDGLAQAPSAPVSPLFPLAHDP